MQRPVIAVRKGNPRRIAGIDDLLRGDVRLGMAHPDQAATVPRTMPLLAGLFTVPQFHAQERFAEISVTPLFRCINDLDNLADGCFFVFLKR
ncbi:MAG: substrate-binding domain-containing protein [Thermoguttaceae bacterium]